MNKDNYIPVITFSGKKSDFRVWKSKYECRLTIMGLVDILDDDIEIPKDSEDVNEDTKRYKLKKDNALVYADLMMSIDQETCFNLMESCKNENYKRGHAPTAWKMICSRFEKRDELHHQELLRTMLTKKLHKEQKPDDWINEMEKTRFDLKQLHNDDTYNDDIKFIKHLLLLIPTTEYSTIYWQIIHQLEENELTYDKFKHQLRSFSRIKTLNIQLQDSKSHKNRE